MIGITTIEKTSLSIVQTFGDDIPVPDKLLKSLQSDNLALYFADKEPLAITKRQDKGRHETIYAWSPYQIILMNPELVIHTGKQRKKPLDRPFWKYIPEELEAIASKLTDISVPVEYRAYLGYYGYLGFEICRQIEKFKSRNDMSRIPLLWLMFPRCILVERENSFLFIRIDLPKSSTNLNNIKMMNLKGSIHHFTSYSEYLNDIEKITSYIRDGEIYQANYTQQFGMNAKNVDPLNLFFSVTREQSLDGAAFLKLNHITILSLSPEVFIVARGDQVHTRPIKGTRPRGLTEREDRELRDELLSSTKDQAELAMIVDLLRNDLGKSSLPGSVNVSSHAVLETFENVHHLVSTVKARINPTISDAWSMLIRAFPGGSISGVPKVRSLEIIEETEKVPRGVYTGNIGYISIVGEMQFNIAIRTAVITNNQAFFNAGGGIVYDSEPLAEYLESLHKAKHLARYFGHSFVGHLVWLNGEIIGSENIQIDVTTKGCFETIRVNDGLPQNLDAHISRLQQGITYYGFETLTLPSISEIKTFCELNLAESARLNIFVYESNGEVNSVMQIREYSEPSSPLSLVLDKSPARIPQAVKSGVKSLDYELYRSRIKIAEQLGAWDTIIVDHQGYIREGGRSTVYLFKDKWITPRLDVVKGTVRSSLLRSKSVEMAEIHLDELNEIRAISVSNALIGIKQVKTLIDETGAVIWAHTSKGSIAELQL